MNTLIIFDYLIVEEAGEIYFFVHGSMRENDEEIMILDLCQINRVTKDEKK